MELRPLRAGDAASLVDPLSGEGIRTADLMQKGEGTPATTRQVGDAVLAALEASL